MKLRITFFEVVIVVLNRFKEKFDQERLAVENACTYLANNYVLIKTWIKNYKNT